MLHQIIFGLLLGWGAAIPIGPINLEIVRRNLNYGTRYGILFGLGASSADLTYLILLCAGALTLLNHIMVLKIIGILGATILAWFGFSALRMQAKANNKSKVIPKRLWQNAVQGYLLTLINPMTILFWSSVSAQIALVALKNHLQAIIFSGLGVILGTMSWVLALNITVHFTRHRLPEKTSHYLNIVGGILLLGFAVFGIYHALTLH